MINRNGKSFLFILLLLSNFAAYAALVEIDWYPDPGNIYPPGNHYLTYDTDTGLEWLDVSLSTGMTRAETEAELLAGGLFGGFSFATDSQLQTLFNSAGISTTSNYYSDYGTIDDHLESLAAGDLSQLVGLGSPDFYFYTGLSGRFALLADDSAGGIYLSEERNPNCWSQYDGITVFCGKSWGEVALPSDWADGSWLVRSTVSEPSTIILISLGFFGITLARRRASLSIRQSK